MKSIHHATFAFLQEIRKENSRDYFKSIKYLYDDILASVSDFCQTLIEHMGITHQDDRPLTPRDCLFRIYRDARRLKPGDYIYKNNFGFAIAPLGKKDNHGGYYIHIEPGNSHFSAGVYRPKGQALRNIRQSIVNQGLAYITHMCHPDFTDRFGSVYGTRLKSMPRGFNHYDKHVDLLQMKQHLIIHRYTDEEVLSENFLEEIKKDIQIAKPRSDRLYRAATEPQE